jgi:hypothetical protein
MHNTKEKKEPVKPPLEEVLNFNFREFLRQTDAFDCINTITDLVLHRDEQFPLSCTDQVNLRDLFYFLRKIHDQTYQRIGAEA